MANRRRDENEEDRSSGTRGGSREQHQRAGRAGAEARWGRGSSSREEDEDQGRRGGRSQRRKSA